MIPDLRELKKQIHKACEAQIDQRVATAAAAMNGAEEALRLETKSSVGDKYETGRAMMQIEIEKNKTQYLKAIHQKAILLQLNPETLCEEVKLGSLVLTSQGTYYISIAIGKIIIEKEVYYAISMESPIAQAMRGLRGGAEIRFQEKSIGVQEII